MLEINIPEPELTQAIGFVNEFVFSPLEQVLEINTPEPEPTQAIRFVNELGFFSVGVRN